MSEYEGSTVFENVSGGATQLQQLLVLQNKDLMLRRYLQYLDQPENSGGQAHSKRRFIASIMVLYEELRPRMKELSEKKKDYPFNVEKLDGDIIKEPEGAMRTLIEYLELDLKLTKIDTRKDFDRKDIMLSNKIKGLI